MPRAWRGHGYPRRIHGSHSDRSSGASSSECTKGGVRCRIVHHRCCFDRGSAKSIASPDLRIRIMTKARLTDQQGKIIFNDVLSAFSKFMEVHKEVVRLSRMNTNIKSLQLSLGRKRKVAAQCEEILNSLQDTVQTGRSFKATR